MPLYPIGLQLNGRPCLVVGGGQVAERKTASLLDCGGVVTLVSPVVTDTIQGWAQEGQITWHQRPFVPEDVAGTLVIIAATNDRAVNELAFQTARQRGILINVVDCPELCDFYVPASVTHRDLQVTVSTNGKSPMLAKQLRQRLEEQFGPEYGPYLELLGRLRSRLKEAEPDRIRRNALEEEFLSSPALSWIEAGRVDKAEMLLARYLAPYSPGSEL